MNAIEINAFNFNKDVAQMKFILRNLICKTNKATWTSGTNISHP